MGGGILGVPERLVLAAALAPSQSHRCLDKRRGNPALGVRRQLSARRDNHKISGCSAGGEI
eukprot:190808-Rhodomonas_salina.1